MKKLRKDKLKQLSNEDDQNKKHRHKHKCGDEFCKHRKHKKRRKHKKHHHRDAESQEDEIKEEGEEEEEEEEEDDDDNAQDNIASPASINANEPTNDKDNDDEVFNPDIKEETMTEEEVASSNTESSGSTYVNNIHLKYIYIIERK